jgi:hypothetical protein
MKRHWPIGAALVLSLATIDAACATAKHRHHIWRAPVAVARAPSFGSARMIEVRPGVIISSYDCITDDGYGRWRPCSDGCR